MEVAFLGLGAMGVPMAATLAGNLPTTVWNRTASVATEHAAGHGSTAIADLADLPDVEVVCSCLPTDVEVAAVAQVVGPRLRAGTVWLDHTSGDPDGSREIAAMLAEHGVRYLDAPVSGGTDGAAAGRLTVMVGGDETDLERARPVLDAVAATVVHVGPVGSGMAVKAVNNALLATALWATGEGLVALRAAGVDPAAALQVINGSSGRSFASETLVPDRVLTRAFPRTFSLGLLAKDVGLASAVIGSVGQDAPMIALADRLTASAAAQLGPDRDHVELVRLLEQAADVVIE